MRKRGLGSKILCGVLAFGLCFNVPYSSAAAGESVTENGFIADGELQNNSTPEPEAWGAVPNANQYQYQKEEMAAFCHFGPNTFNEVEWGENYGDKTPDEIFTLEKDFDADTLVKSLKDAGFKKVIVTAKHHDGFCIWNSAYTDYDIANTSYKDGNGDILAELSKACTEQNMEMGLYLSPWDIHEPSYGYHDANGNPTTPENDVLDYNEHYNNQLIEILGNDKYGNAGHFNEIWMDGAKGSGANAQVYDFEKWFDTIQSYEGKKGGYEEDCLLYGAGAHTTVAWVGNEDGRASETAWSKGKIINNSLDTNNVGGVKKGYEDGTNWAVIEADTSITSGWFWGTKKKTPKSLSDFGNIYFNTVGRNATLLLNVPPNNEGTVDKEILDRLAEFGKEINDTFQVNLAEGAACSASEVRGNDVAFKAGNVIDGRDDTYWAAEDGTTKASLIIDLGAEKTFDVISLEEAIQLGQRIKAHKVEYRTGNGEWKTFSEGTTIGAKRLHRRSAVKADQVKVTVETSQAAPMLSEVGIFKASEKFQIGGVDAPEGMEILDVADSSHFKINGWTLENDVKFLNGTNIWSSNNNPVQLTFKGTKVYLMGSTKQSSAGTADIYIDGNKAGSFNRVTGRDAFGQVLYVSEDLEDGEHTLELRKTGGTIALEAAYVINNGGKGMIELEQGSYTMNEDETINVVVNRVGGTNGEVTAILEPNPGSAIQDDFDTAPKVITIGDGENKGTVPVTTRRNYNTTGDREFSIQLTTPSEGLIIGFAKTASVTIRDAEGINEEKLQALVDECAALIPEHYTNGWDVLQEKINAAKEILAAGEAERGQLQAAYSALETAKEALVKREKYTAEDPFCFPWKAGSSSILEAEFAETITESNPNDRYKVGIREGDWASNGKYINSLNVNDVVEYPYFAEKTGIYKATLTYQSGSTNNKLSWSEKDNKIKGNEVSAGANNAAEVHTVEFEFEVLEAGAGTLIFTGPNGDSPRLDKFVIEPKSIDLERYTVTATAGKGGSINPDGETEAAEGESITYTITPDSGYMISDVLVNGASVGAVASYEMADLSGNATIEAVFTFVNYTEENRFQFPTEIGGEAATLEAEYFILTNTGDNEQWPLKVSEGDWASNGKFINSLNANDKITLYYNAAEAGTYKVTVTYRSGDPNNKLVWAEANGKIASGEQAAGADDAARATHTAEFELEVLEAGEGTLVFTGPSTQSPQTDKFDIVRLENEPQVQEFTITATAGEGGSINPEGQVTVTEGENQTFTIVPEEGFEIADVAVDGISKGAITEYTFENVKADGTIQATFKSIEKPVGLDWTGLNTQIVNAEERLKQTDSYRPDELAKLQAYVDAGKELYDKEGVTQDEIDAAAEAISSYLDSMTRIQRFTITATAGEGGSISPKGEVTVEEGGNQTFTIVPEEGFEIADVVVDGTSKGAVAEYTFENVKADGTIKAIFKRIEKPVVIDKTGLNSQIQNAEERLKQTDIYRADDLEKLQVLVDAGKAVYRNEAATQEEVDKAAEAIRAYMERMAPIQKFTITAAAGEGGSINPSGKVVVKEGESQTFEIVPSEGYEIADVTVNGQSKGAVSRYTFDAVTADAEITAVFKVVEEPTVPEAGKVTDDTNADKNAAGTDIVTSMDDLADMVLSEEDKDELEAGKDISIRLVVSDLSEGDLSETDRNLILAAIGDRTAGTYFDFRLFKEVGGNATEIAETKGEITVSLKVPESLLNQDGSVERTYSMMRLHDGRAELLKCDFDGTAVTFKTDKFSTYVLVYSDAEKTPSVDTGDSTNIILWFALMAAAVAGMTVMKRKRVNRGAQTR